MQIVKEDIDQLNALLKVQIEKADYEDKVNHALKDYRKKVNLKGFRPGKVPMGLVKNMIGNQVLAEEVQKILQEEIDSFIMENKLDILGYPLPKFEQQIDLSIKNPTDYEFTYELGIAPEIDLKYLDKKPKFNLEQVKIEDAMVDDELMKMRKRGGTPVEAEGNLQDDDILNVELAEQGKEEGEGVVNATSLPVDIITDKKVQKALKKAKKDDVLDVPDIMKLTDKSEHEIAQYFLNVKEDELAELNKKFTMKILSIRRIEPAEMNQEFFNKTFGEGEINSEEELRDRINTELENHYKHQSEQKMLSEIVKAMIEKIKIDLPEEFLKKWIKASNEKPISDEELEKDFPGFTQNLKWSLILKRLAKDNEITVAPEEIKERLALITRQQMMQYGMYNITDEQMETYVNTLLQKREEVDKVRERILEDKVLGVVKEKVKINEKNVSLEQFTKSLEK